MKRIVAWLTTILTRWIVPIDPELLEQSGRVVREIEKDQRHRAMVEREGNIQFCPRCGQKPSRDYRCDEAFYRLSALFPKESRADIYLAIEFSHRKLR